MHRMFFDECQHLNGIQLTKNEGFICCWQKYKDFIIIEKKMQISFCSLDINE